MVDINDEFFIFGDNCATLLNCISKAQICKRTLKNYKNGLEYINELTDYQINPKVTYRIGGRMGKPEGAKLREMKPSIHSLFPVGHEIGNNRKIHDVILKEAKIELGYRYCNICNTETIKGVCCKENTEYIESKFDTFDVSNLWNEAKQKMEIYDNL